MTEATYHSMGQVSQVVLVVKNPPANAGGKRDPVQSPGLGRSAGEHSNSLQYSCLENPMDRITWGGGVIVHWLTKSWT